MIKKGDEMRLHSFYLKSNKKINDNKELDYIYIYIYIYILIEMHKKKAIGYHVLTYQNRDRK
jgi:hypothetical protein